MKSDPQLASLAESLSGADHDSAISTTVGRGSPEAIYEDLRARILSGAIAAGADLVQVKVADQYGVSRGPVREAFRLLQREGLIVSEVNLRARVTELSADEVDHLYALRVVNECLALRVSVPLFCSAELDELDQEIKETKKSARMAPNLPEKLELQRKLRGLESKRDEAWRAYDSASCDVDRQKDTLLDEIRRRLEQKTECEALFTLRWRLA